MHVLHRPYLHRAIAVTAIAAVLAIILTLAIAQGLNDLASAPRRATAPSPATGLQASAIRSGARPSVFTGSPFSSLLTAPVTAPWAQDIR
jgi:hypothetical protein